MHPSCSTALDDGPQGGDTHPADWCHRKCGRTLDGLLSAASGSVPGSSRSKSVHRGIGHSRNLVKATAVSLSETGTTPINRTVEENLPCLPKLSSKLLPKNKPVGERSCAAPAEGTGSLCTSCFC